MYVVRCATVLMSTFSTHFTLFKPAQFPRSILRGQDNLSNYSFDNSPHASASASTFPTRQWSRYAQPSPAVGLGGIKSGTLAQFMCRAPGRSRRRRDQIFPTKFSTASCPGEEDEVRGDGILQYPVTIACLHRLSLSGPNHPTCHC